MSAVYFLCMFVLRVIHWSLLKIRPVFLSPIVANACRCFGRRGPSLPPSSSLMRSTLSPVKEEGAVGYFCQHHRKRPMFRRKETEINIQSTVPAHSGDCSLLTTATVRCLLFSALWSFIVRRWQMRSHRCGLLQFAVPACLTKIHSWIDGANIPKSLHDCTIKASHSVPMVSAQTFAAFRYRRTQNTVLCGGASVGWHWEHLWLKGKRMGGGGGGQRTEDTDRRRTNTSLCPYTADGEGQICSMLPGKPVDETKCCRKEHRQANRPLGPFNSSDRCFKYYYTAIQRLRHVFTSVILLKSLWSWDSYPATKTFSIALNLFFFSQLNHQDRFS